MSGGLSVKQVPKKREKLWVKFFFSSGGTELRDDLIKSVEMTNSIMSAEENTMRRRKKSLSKSDSWIRNIEKMGKKKRRR